MSFLSFLKEFFTEKQIDASVYESYLVSVLEDNTDDIEKVETLTDILSSLIEESDVPSTVELILEKWKSSLNPPKKDDVTKETPKKEVNIAELMRLKETQISSSESTSRKLTEEEKRIKEQILAAYSQTETKSEEVDVESDESEDELSDGLEKNTNKSDVNKLAKEKREQAKLESQQKKLKDKEDRAKQKASRDEKKAKRQAASQKGERKR